MWLFTTHNGLLYGEAIARLLSRCEYGASHSAGCKKTSWEGYTNLERYYFSTKSLSSKRKYSPTFREITQFLEINISLSEKHPNFSEIHPPTCRGIFHFYLYLCGTIMCNRELYWVPSPRVFEPLSGMKGLQSQPIFGDKLFWHIISLFSEVFQGPFGASTGLMSHTSAGLWRALWAVKG